MFEFFLLNLLISIVSLVVFLSLIGKSTGIRRLFIRILIYILEVCLSIFKHRIAATRRRFLPNNTLLDHFKQSKTNMWAETFLLHLNILYDLFNFSGYPNSRMNKKNLTNLLRTECRMTLRMSGQKG